MRTCKSCRHFSPNPGEGEGGACRCNPPRAELIPTKMGGLTPIGIFPPTQWNNWCGAYASTINPE